MRCRQLQGGILESFDTAYQYANSFHIFNLLKHLSALLIFTYPDFYHLTLNQSLYNFFRELSPYLYVVSSC